MCSKTSRLYLPLLLLLVGMGAAVPAFAGSPVIGSVAGSVNATVGGQALLPNSTLFSGDSLEVNDGAAVVAVAGGSRVVLGRDTVASFLRDANEVTVLLSQGNVSVYQADGTVMLRVKAGDISIVPGKGFRTLGEVATVGGALQVTSKEGTLRVEGGGPAVEVASGKTITIRTKTARAPQGGAAGGGARISSSVALQVGSLGASAASAILSGIAISRANDAKSAATLADTDAKSAISAANAATAAAMAAGGTSNSVGCALDGLAFQLGIASPYTPGSGYTCP